MRQAPCWINPSGEIIPVKSHGHADFARQFLNLPYSTSGNAAILALANEGWLHIGFTDFVSFKPYAELSESQYTALHILLREYKDTMIGDAIVSYMFT